MGESSTPGGAEVDSRASLPAQRLLWTGRQPRRLPQRRPSRRRPGGCSGAGVPGGARCWPNLDTVSALTVWPGRLAYGDAMSPESQNKLLFQTRATAHGGRAGYIETPDHHLAVKLSVPQEIGGDGGVGTNPEQLLAAGYAACFQSAIGVIARRDKVTFGSSRVTGVVGLRRDELGYVLDIELQIVLPGLSPEEAQHMVDEAHKVCPYSRALRGDVSVRLTVVEEQEPAQGQAEPITAG